MSVALRSSDLILRLTDGTVSALVEAKNRQGWTPDLAIRYRRNLLAHGMVDEARYFLLLSQDRGFLWEPSLATSYDRPPDLSFAVSPVIDRYVPNAQLNGRLTEGGLTIVVTQWLSDLAAGRYQSDVEPERSLGNHGFLEAIRDAHVVIGDDA
jgi:hypothetical protein